MPIPYKDIGPVDPSVVPDISTLNNKSVVITGGSSGIGAACVKAFLEAGAYVTNADMNPGEAHVSSSNYNFVRCDVRQWEDQVAVFKSAIAKSPHKGVDIVVANAGISGQDSLFKLDEEDEPTEPDLNVIYVNLHGVLYTSRLAMHYFSKQPVEAARDRCLIITASLAGYLDPVGAPLYQTSKFGVRGLMCNLRQSDRLRVNLIAPFFVDTPILGDSHADNVRKMLAERGLAFALPEDCAKAMLRTATDTSINGRALGVVPKQMKPEGYLDLEHDEPRENTILHLIRKSGEAKMAMEAARAQG